MGKRAPKPGVVTFIVKANCKSIAEALAFVNSMTEHSENSAPNDWTFYDAKFATGEKLTSGPEDEDYDDMTWTAEDLHPDASFGGLPHWIVTYPSEGGQ